MASSSNRKSNSSVSKASKPTFRRAGSKPAAARPAPAVSAAPRPAQKPISSYTARARVAKPSAKPRKAPSAAPARKPVQKPAPRAAVKPQARTRRAPLKVPAATPRVQNVSAAPSPQQKPARGAALKMAARRPAPGTVSTVPAQARPARKGAAGPAGALIGLVGGVLGGAVRVVGKLLSGKVVALVIAVALLLGIGGIVVVNSPLFAATDIQIEGSEHVSAEAARQLIQVPEGTTLLNVDTAALTAELSENPWVSGVTVEREFPHTLRITPTERAVAAIVYIPSDDIAWAIGDDACWIAPVSLSVTVDAEGNVVDAVPGDGDAATDAAATQQLTGVDAARALARADGAVLFTDVPADVEPSTGREVTSDVVLAGLAYANGFSDSFIAQIQSLSLPSVDAITAYLDSGVEVSLGSPEDIATKERVVTRLLEQQQGVTYVNVRVPDNYTFRSAPAV